MVDVLRRWAPVMAAASVVVLAGCAGSAAKNPIKRDRVPAAVAVRLDSLDCAAPPSGAGGLLPDRDWVALASCPAVLYQAPTKPQAPTVTHGDLRPLVTALNQPDPPRPKRAICPADMVMLPGIWLVDGDGEAYAPHIPRDACGRPTRPVLSALRGLGLL
jgi:hypothetical protein